MNDEEGQVLHTLRCMGVSSVERVADAAGMGVDDAEGSLIGLGAAGFVTRHGGVFGGWGVTGAGKAADARWAEREIDAAGTRGVLTEAYREFEGLNLEVLDLCTAWQMRAGGVLNDHRDAGYDRRVLAGLVEVDGRAATLIEAMAGAAGRFRRYRERLGAALGRVRAGETGYVTDEVGSYHGIWFQLHEDLLVTLGIPR
ncbi:transcriptional regulator [Actinoplanes sp. NPDC049265]|uniref:transcriptional regulator n=1 Tax=Actinoplanes sp. NPDC049265 TaxID=3363902 RepID=UPI00371F6F25